MKQFSFAVATLAIGLTALTACETAQDDAAIAQACIDVARDGLREIADDRSKRFLGKVEDYRARCRGGETAVAQMPTPWVDWSNYWATGDESSRSTRRDSGIRIANRNQRGIDGALIDLEYQRMELIRFNLFDNSGTFETYVNGGTSGDKTLAGPIVKQWPEMRLARDNPDFKGLRVSADGSQVCDGELIRHRELTGICNDIRNPAMGAAGQKFARNVQFEATFPEQGRNELARNRHGDRIGLLKPDPQVISRKLFSRRNDGAESCNDGMGAAGGKGEKCPYREAPFFNVLAAFWIQFMTHDWFAHTDEGANDSGRMLTDLGCRYLRSGNVEKPLSAAEAAQLGCRPQDRIDAALFADTDEPATFDADGRSRLARSYRTSRNNVTAWWDASQIYGYSERSQRRVKRDPKDPAKLLTIHVGNRPGAGESQGYLPLFQAACASTGGTNCDPILPTWQGQEATAFPDNWTVGLSFYHNLFTREHNLIVDEFRQRAKATPDEDSGLRDPARPDRPISYAALSDEELFQVARLIVSAEIAKIHTIEWTTQLLYDKPLDMGMNANWGGLFAEGSLLSNVTARIVERHLAPSTDPVKANLIYSALSAGPGIVGRGNNFFPTPLDRKLGNDKWDLTNPDHVNGGVNHFGSPFNFPEEFVTVYRLHPLVPDLIEMRDWRDSPNTIRHTVPVAKTFRKGATPAMHDEGIANWALSMGRQRLGLLLLHNHPRFLQNLDLRPRIDTTIDIPALDIIRDREHGLPRFNEFRRQIGLKQLTSFDDFIDKRPSASPETVAEQNEFVATMREIYGQHRCDASKVISTAQRGPDGDFVDDCLGHPDGSMVDNIEDVDTVVGYLAETTRPHGFAISETMFHIFILNASRRLFSDRFFTSSFRPEFYTKLGIDWVMNNGPDGKHWEKGEPNGEKREVMPLKRVLLRTIPELAPELDRMVNSFDPWARDRGEYYSLDWKPRPDAVGDDSFRAQ